MSPVLLGLSQPNAIRTDSGYDKIARYILDLARERGSLRVLCDQCNTLGFYLRDEPASQTIQLDWFVVHSQEQDAAMYVTLMNHLHDVVVSDSPKSSLYSYTGLTFSYTDAFLFANSTHIVTFPTHPEGAIVATGVVYLFQLTP